MKLDLKFLISDQSTSIKQANFFILPLAALNSSCLFMFICMNFLKKYLSPSGVSSQQLSGVKVVLPPSDT